MLCTSMESTFERDRPFFLKLESSALSIYPLHMFPWHHWNLSKMCVILDKEVMDISWRLPSAKNLFQDFLF